MTDSPSIELPDFNPGKDMISAWHDSLKYGFGLLFALIAVSTVMNRTGGSQIASLAGAAVGGYFGGVITFLFVWELVKRVIQSDYDACMRCLTSEPHKPKENERAKIFAGTRLCSFAESSDEALHAIAYLLTTNWLPKTSIAEMIETIGDSAERGAPYAMQLTCFLSQADHELKIAAANALNAIAGERIGEDSELSEQWLQSQGYDKSAVFDEDDYDRLIARTREAWSSSELTKWIPDSEKQAKKSPEKFANIFWPNVIITAFSRCLPEQDEYIISSETAPYQPMCMLTNKRVFFGADDVPSGVEYGSLDWIRIEEITEISTKFKFPTSTIIELTLRSGETHKIKGVYNNTPFDYLKDRVANQQKLTAV